MITKWELKERYSGSYGRYELISISDKLKDKVKEQFLNSDLEEGKPCEHVFQSALKYVIPGLTVVRSPGDKINLEDILIFTQHAAASIFSQDAIDYYWVSPELLKLSIDDLNMFVSGCEYC